MEVEYELRRLVKKVEARRLSELQVINPNTRTINYQFGHPLEIVNTIKSYTASDTFKYEKFPLVALFTPVITTERSNSDYNSCKLWIVIVNNTSKNYKAHERNIENFIPVLNPIYTSLLNEIARSPYFAIADPNRDMPHTKLKHDYWGKDGLYGQTGNLFDDYVDAIEIRDLTLNLSNIIKC